MIGFLIGLAAMYLFTGGYIYSHGRSLNLWLADDKKVTFSAILGWPATVRRVMSEGVNTPT